MRRIALTCVVLLAVGGGAFAALGAGTDEAGGGHTFKVELDNAFGLIGGGDVKIAGVRAGKIGKLKVDPKTHRAVVEIKITRDGFGSVRTDASCEVRPQSLIGEYFVDCNPGTATTKLQNDALIPVERTSSTVAPDLVNDILRTPYKERFRIILNELGAGVAGNVKNLNDAIRRANPALRETDKTLKILATQNKILGGLAKDADAVITKLAKNKVDVARWVDKAKGAAQTSAERASDISKGFHNLPGFLEQLRPNMVQLGRVAREQTPALADLNVSATRLKQFFDLLTPFARASKPAFQALGRAGAAGKVAVKAAQPEIKELNRFAKGTPELGKNLAIVLEHLDNRDHAVEADPRSPGGKGYTGIEALLTYIFDQTMSTNVFDSTQHILKVAVFDSPCAAYADVAAAKPLLEQCAATLGPIQPGVTTPDPTKPAGATKRNTKQAAGKTPVPSVAPGQKPLDKLLPKAPSLKLPKLPDILPGIKIGPLGKLLRPGGGLLPNRPRSGVSRRTQTQLLDYLLAP